MEQGVLGACPEGPQFGTEKSPGKFLGFLGASKTQKTSYTEQIIFSSIILNLTLF